MIIDKDNFLSELKNKNPLVIDFVIDEYGAVMKRVILRNLYSNKENWEECFNDVLLAIWNNPDRFDDKRSNFKNWICAIAKYKAIDSLRREIKHQENNVNIDDEDCVDWLNKVYATENGIEIKDDSIEELSRLLACLSDEDKDLFYRRYVDEQPIEEIAIEKNMDRNLIYTRISRGKKKIKNHMEITGGVTNE